MKFNNNFIKFGYILKFLGFALAAFRIFGQLFGHFQISEISDSQYESDSERFKKLNITLAYYYILPFHGIEVILYYKTFYTHKL